MQSGGNSLKIYIREHFRALFAALIVFAIGNVAGSVYCVYLPLDAQGALQEAFAVGKGHAGTANGVQVFTATFLNYFQVWLFLWLCGTGSFGVVFASFLIGMRGFVCGFAVTTLLMVCGRQGLFAAGADILPQMLLILPTLQAFYAVIVARAYICNRITDRLRRRQLFFKYCIITMLFLMVFLLAALYEGYVGWHLVLKLLS